MSVIDRLAETWIPVLWQASWQGAITVLVVIVMCWLLRVAKSPESTQNWALAPGLPEVLGGFDHHGSDCDSIAFARSCTSRIRDRSSSDGHADEGCEANRSSVDS